MPDPVGSDTRPAEADDEPGATQAILGANPFVGVRARDLAGAVGRFAVRIGGQPGALLREGTATLAELTRVTFGRSKLAPERGDGRFQDATWVEHPAYRRAMQAYLAGRAGVHRLLEAADLDWKARERARFGVTLLTEAAAPTNTLPGNPAALKRAYETGGASLVRGASHFLSDLRHNGGMPSMVDRSPFDVGRNLAVTPGAVVYRDEVLEVIQYAPAADQVREIPLVMIPPQINKYYITDLAPGRSIVEFLVAGGVPTFMVSWRNPTREMREWGLDTYVAAAKEALAVAAEVVGSQEVNVSGFCAGGVTTAVLLGHLAAQGDRRVRSAMFGVTLLDMTAPSIFSVFASPSTLAAARRRSGRAGVLEGRDMARIFAWLRPNDLVWNYFVNNYLLGNDPPAFDILYWNDDTTRLPARLHHDFLDLALTPLGDFGGHPRAPGTGTLEVLGTSIDLSKVDCDTYLVAGMTDHIVPWEGAYATTQILGGETEFVLGSSGHIQSLVNPPTNPKARFFTGGDLSGSARDWLASATETRGSWWPHWLAWLEARSGGRRPAPAELGSAAHPPLDPAPGRYVKER